MPRIVLIAENVRSSHNVGALLRTADGLGVAEVYLTGYSAHPSYPGDQRLPHIKAKADKQIRKTALGAENSVKWQYIPKTTEVVKILKSQGFSIVGLEQDKSAQNLINFRPPAKIALIVGNEVSGLGAEILASCDSIIEIPMLGQKESHNITVATAIAIYHLTAHS